MQKRKEVKVQIGVQESMKCNDKHQTFKTKKHHQQQVEEMFSKKKRNTQSKMRERRGGKCVHLNVICGDQLTQPHLTLLARGCGCRWSVI